MATVLKTIAWKGFAYTAKPFTLDALFSVYEITASNLIDGRLQMRDMFRDACPLLLKGSTPEAEAELQSGKFAASILTEETEVAEAFRVKREVDFLYNSTYEQGEKLKKSAPDLADTIQAAQKKSSRASQTNTANEVEHSG